MRRALCSLLFVFMMSLCAAKAPPSPAEGLFDHDQALGARSLPADQALDALLADSLYMPFRGAGGFARTSKEAKAALLAGPFANVSALHWQPVRVGVSADGQHGFTAGYQTLTQADGSKRNGKYLAYWKQNASQWRVFAYRITPAAAAAADTKRWPDFNGSSDKIADEPKRFAASLRAAEQAFSDRAQKIGLGPAFAEYGRDDALNLGGGASADIIRGADAIGKLVGDGQPETGSSVFWAADVHAEVADSGDLGITFGYIRLHPPAGQAASEPAPPIPFFTVWARSGKQPWRYIAE